METCEHKKQTEDKEKVKESSENQTNNASGEVSSNKPSQETGLKFNRFKLFDKVIQRSLDKYLQMASFSKFASSFRPLYKKDPERMESIHKQFIEVLQGSIKEDISKLIEEGHLELKLNELDDLEKAAQENPDPAWRPSGDPDQDFCSFLLPYYQKQEAYMRLELKKIQAENVALAQKVQAGREGINQTEHRISTAVEEWKASVTEFKRLASSLCPTQGFDN